MSDDLLYDIDLLSKVSKYNKDRFYANLKGKDFSLNLDYERILKARYQKSSRIKRRMVYLFSRYKYIWFCTFTFSNDYIDKCTRTKRDLIKKCINNYDFKYILNVDYGESTQREHYHCLLATNEEININDYIKENYPCFSCNILCKSGLDDFIRLRKYIDKLVNHCIKPTTAKQRLVYNFKGYDIFPDSHQASLFYMLDYDILFCEAERNLYNLLYSKYYIDN